MKKIGIVIILAVLAMLGVAYVLFGARLTAAYNSNAAEQAREAGDLARAAALYERVLTRSPRDEELRLKVSGLYEDAGNFSRAEFVIWEGLRGSVPSAALYGRLCALYVAQDKLSDAAELLEGIEDASLREEVAARRPPPPVFSLPGGVYEQRIEVSLAAEGTVYVSWTGGIPSVETGLYTEPAALDPGVTSARALAVGEGGFVSDWAVCEYELINIIDPILFEDPSVERLIRAALNKPDGLLYSSDLWAVETLASEEAASFATLNDLAHCRELRSLSLTGSGNNCDVSALPQLQKLSELSLTSFGIDSAELELIGLLPALTKLFLPGNSIGSVAPLERLTGLTDLDISGNYILDAAPLGTLGALQTLNISRNAVQTLAGLSPLSGLLALSAAENPLVSLGGAEGLSSLQNLDVSYCPGLESLDEIARLTALTRVTAGHCGLQRLPDLSACAALSQLDVSSNALGTLIKPGSEQADDVPEMLGGLEGLEGLTSLKFMSCADNFVSSLAPLSGCLSLQWLDASGNEISSAEPLRGLPALGTLWVENNNLSSLLPLKGCPSIKEIHAFGNDIGDPIDSFAGTGIEVSGLS
ncbi:MAG: tetratricopeptide repeat protein [Oscillospiraceae bacterium]|jgi:Leucine-rich repeat (LRR) protein|nr:tetratricopeptide repeat protein [Oscillospiraceae bacterium]